METLPRDKHYTNIFNRYIVINIHIILLSIWLLSQIIIFILYFIQLQNNTNLTFENNLFGYGFLFAKSSALLININFVLLFLFVNKFILTFVLNLSLSLPLYYNNTYHIYIVSSIYIFSVIHTISHLYNFYIFDRFNSLTTTVSGITGIILILSFMIIFFSSFKYIRLHYYTFFSLIHLLYIVILITLLFHGSFCFLQTDNGECLGPTFWQYIITPFFLFIIEYIYREIYGHKSIIQNIKTLKGTHNITKINIYKPYFQFKPGQWVLIQIPTISFLQWHPFTITSNHIETGIVQLYIKESGDWTKKVSKLLLYEGIKNKLNNIKIKVSQPYGYSYDVTKYRVCVLIAGGIGITSFISLLKALPCSTGHGKSKNIYLKKIYIHWICRELSDFDCFLIQLKKLKQDFDKIDSKFLILNFHITGFSAQLNYRKSKLPLLDVNTGRPDFHNILSFISDQHINTKIKLLISGSNSMNNDVLDNIQSTLSNGNYFEYLCIGN